MDYKDVPVDRTDPRSEEPLVDLADYGIAGSDFYARDDGLNAPYGRCFASATGQVKARRSVAEHLAQVNAGLRALGVEVYVLDAFRPLSLQQELWDFFFDRAKRVLDHPSETDCVAFAGEYCSDPRHFDPDNPRTWPAHFTGGSIDLTLRGRQSREPLFMGGIFDDPDPLSHTAFYEKLLIERGGRDKDLALSHREALRNRRLLYWSMIEVGFSNYAFEWWHFDLGTQMWVVNSDWEAAVKPPPQHAWYGPVER